VYIKILQVLEGIPSNKVSKIAKSLYVSKQVENNVGNYQISSTPLVILKWLLTPLYSIRKLIKYFSTLLVYVYDIVLEEFNMVNKSLSHCKVCEFCFILFKKNCDSPLAMTRFCYPLGSTTWTLTSQNWWCGILM
jgi:hypothetical protein